MLLPNAGQSCPEPLCAPRALVSSSASHDTQIADYLSADFLNLNVAFHESGCFSFIGLGKLSGLSWDLEFAAVSAEQLMRAFMSCLQDMSTCGEVLVSLLCYLVASFTRFWFQLLRKNVSSSACKELHVHLGLFSCVCFNFVFCNFFEVLHPKAVSASKNVPRANCLDHTDTQGILLGSFRISRCSLGVWN